MLLYQLLAPAHNWLLAGIGLGLLFGTPWIVAAAWMWRRGVGDGAATPSPGETALRRLGL